MGSGASVATLAQKQEGLPGGKSKKDSIVVEIVGANNLSECNGHPPKGKSPSKDGCNSYVKFWLTSGDDLETVKGVKASTLTRVNAFDPVFRSYRCLYSPADPNDILHFEVWNDTISSRPVAHVRVSVSEAGSGFVLIKKLHVLHPNPIKSSESDNHANEIYTVGVKQASKTYKTSLAQDATISFRVLFPHKTKGWRRRRTVFVIRHGESKWNAALANKNLAALMHFDHPLSMRGITQAKTLEYGWLAELKERKISLSAPATVRKLKAIHASDFGPFDNDDDLSPDPLNSSLHSLENSLEHSLEDTASVDVDVDDDDSDDAPAPVREQMNMAVAKGGGGDTSNPNPNAVCNTSNRTSNPNAVCNTSNRTSNPNAVFEDETAKGTEKPTTTAANTTKDGSPRNSSSPSTTSHPSSTTANASGAKKLEVGRPSSSPLIYPPDEAASKLAKGMPLTPASFRKHIESKIEARDTPTDKETVFRRKAKVVIRKNEANSAAAALFAEEADIADTDNDDNADLTPGVQSRASSIGLSLNDQSTHANISNPFHFKNMELVHSRQSDKSKLDVIRTDSSPSSMVLTPRTGHSHHTHTDLSNPTRAPKNFDFVLTEDSRVERRLVLEPEEEPPDTNNFDDSCLRFYGATAVFSSPLTRATQTALLSLASHPVLINSGLTLLASLREKKTQGGFDSVGKVVGEEIYNRTEEEMAATLLAAKYRAKGSKADAAYININTNTTSNAELSMPEPDPAEQARRAMRNIHPFDCVTQWWIPVQFKDSKQALHNRISDFINTMEYHPTEGAIVVVGHSLFIRTFLGTYLSSAFKQKHPELAAEMSQQKLQNAGCVRVDLDFQSDSVGGATAIVNAELMFGSKFGESSANDAVAMTQYQTLPSAAKGPPSYADQQKQPRVKSPKMGPSPHLSPVTANPKFANRQLHNRLDSFSLHEPAASSRKVLATTF